MRIDVGRGVWYDVYGWGDDGEFRFGSTGRGTTGSSDLAVRVEGRRKIQIWQYG